jgi:hypothetical protein
MVKTERVGVDYHVCGIIGYNNIWDIGRSLLRFVFSLSRIGWLVSLLIHCVYSFFCV